MHNLNLVLRCPVGTTVKIHLIPINDAGDGPESELAQIVVP